MPASAVTGEHVGLRAVEESTEEVMQAKHHVHQVLSPDLGSRWAQEGAQEGVQDWKQSRMSCRWRILSSREEGGGEGGGGGLRRLS